MRAINLLVVLCALVASQAQASIEMSKDEITNYLKNFDKAKAIRIFERTSNVFVETNDNGEKKEFILKNAENFLETVETLCSNTNSLAIAPKDATSKDKEIVCWAKPSASLSTDPVVAAPPAEPTAPKD